MHHHHDITLNSLKHKLAQLDWSIEISWKCLKFTLTHKQGCENHDVEHELTFVTNVMLKNI
jgi:hypothetical protein